MSPISFKIVRVRNFLLEHREVFTWRKNLRAFFNKHGTNEVEHAWMNENRGKPKICNVSITFELKTCALSELKPYVSKSSFSELEEWKQAIILHGKLSKEEYGNLVNHGILLGYLYYVRVKP